MTKTIAYRKLSRLGEDDRLLLIYRAAARIFHEKGFAATSIDDIAAAVGITKGGLYHYIDGKESLLFNIMNYTMDTLAAEVMTPVETIPGAEEKLRLLVRLHAELIIDKVIEMTMVMDETAGLTVEHLAQITERRMAYYRFLRRILEQLKDEGKLREFDLTVAAHSLIGQLKWLAHWYRPDGRLKRDQMLEEFTRLAVGGVLRPGLRLVKEKSQINNTTGKKQHQRRRDRR